MTSKSHPPSLRSNVHGHPNIILPTKIQLAGIQKHECGYCHSGNPEGSVAWGFVSPQMSVRDYEHLMLQGWRRSGDYFYKPQLHMTCCPAYTIRLPVAKFKPSKSQKKVLRRAHKKLSSEDNEIDDTVIARETGEDDPKDGNEKQPAAVPSSEDTKHSKKIAKKKENKELHMHQEEEPKGEEEEDIIIETEKASFSDEKFQLYKSYQVTIHHDKEEEVTEKGFTRFLITSPLIDSRDDYSSSLGYAYGTYHQLYRLKRSKKLIAVGVIDLLPSGVSSVYCFYDHTNYSSLSLGKYTALKEIEFCQSSLLSSSPSSCATPSPVPISSSSSSSSAVSSSLSSATLAFPYYYMGFYIHNCVKMRYKGEYAPSELLDCKTYQFFSLDTICIPALEKHSFTPFSSPAKEEFEALMERKKQKSEVKAETTDKPETKQPPRTLTTEELKAFLHSGTPSLSKNKLMKLINEIPLELGESYGYRVIQLNVLTDKFQEMFEPLLIEWLDLVGPEIAKKFHIMLY
jgi:arginine-tRNA-protein transferase